MDLSQIKSLEPVEDSEKIFELLSESYNSPNATSRVKRTEDGRVSVEKASFLAAGVERLTTDKIKELIATRGIDWRDEYAERVIPWWASDERVDHHGDIVEQSWNFDTYQNNPILLWSHDWEGLPVGNAIDWQILSRKAGNYEGKALRLDCLFATEDQYPVADTLYRLAKAQFLRTGSVGFFPGEVLDVKDPAERQKLGLGRTGFVLRDNQLVEFSPCSVPANAGAFQVFNFAKTRSLVKPGDVQVLREMVRLDSLRKQMDNKSWLTRDSSIATLWRTLFREAKLPDAKSIDDCMIFQEVNVSSRTISGPTKKGGDPTPPSSTEDDATEPEPKSGDADFQSEVRDFMNESATTNKTIIDKLDELSRVVEESKREQARSGPRPKGGDSRKTPADAESYLEDVLKDAVGTKA